MILLHWISMLGGKISAEKTNFISSAYHGHLSSLVELSTYEFKKYKSHKQAPEHVHIVSIVYRNQ